MENLNTVNLNHEDDSVVDYDYIIDLINKNREDNSLETSIATNSDDDALDSIECNTLSSEYMNLPDSDEEDETRNLDEKDKILDSNDLAEEMDLLEYDDYDDYYDWDLLEEEMSLEESESTNMKNSYRSEDKQPNSKLHFSQIQSDCAYVLDDGKVYFTLAGDNNLYIREMDTRNEYSVSFDLFDEVKVIQRVNNSSDKLVLQVKDDGEEYYLVTDLKKDNFYLPIRKDLIDLAQEDDSTYLMMCFDAQENEDGDYKVLFLEEFSNKFGMVRKIEETFLYGQYDVDEENETFVDPVLKWPLYDRFLYSPLAQKCFGSKGNSLVYYSEDLFSFLIADKHGNLQNLVFYPEYEKECKVEYDEDSQEFSIISDKMNVWFQLEKNPYVLEANTMYSNATEDLSMNQEFRKTLAKAIQYSILSQIEM